MSTHSTRIVALESLGNCASLGSFYNAHQDSFCSFTLFRNQPPQECICTQDSNAVEVKFNHSDTYSSKFGMLDIKANLQLSILAGLFKLNGYGKYLEDEKTSARSVQSSLLYSIRTKTEQLDLSCEAIKDCISFDVLTLIASQGLATHCVTGIHWGAKSIVTVEYANSEHKEKKEVEGMLQAEFDKIAISIKGKAEVDYKAGEDKNSKNFSIKLFGDFLPGNQLPQNVDQALELIKQLPSLVQAANNGKGKQILYILTPLSVLTEIFKLDLQQHAVVKEIDQAIIEHFVLIFDEICNLKNSLNDLQTDMERNQVCLAEESFKEVSDTLFKLRQAETQLRSNFRQLVVSIRAGTAPAEELNNLLCRFIEDKALDNTKAFLRVSSKITEKIAFVNTMKEIGVIYIGKASVLQTEKIRLKSDELIIFFYKTTNDDLELCKENQSLFVSMIGNTPSESKQKRIYILADVDICPELLSGEGVGEGVRICMYRNGSYIDKDILLDHKIKASLCYATSNAVEFVQFKPNNRVVLELPCPLSSEGSGCSRENREWMCKRCNELLEYSFDDYFHCDCGRAKSSSFSFKCSDKHHGTAYNCFGSDHILKHFLAKIRHQKEINILILGKTGVGKSTWINGLANYLSFASLEETEKGDLIKLIPGSFTMFDEEHQKRVISTGSDANERNAVGSSCTVEPKAYVFSSGDTLVRLIDTPGIGDTAGLDQDAKNMEMTFRFISQYKELHGICILLKPNDARLDVIFRFCIKELLVHLHKSASTNICFCFTNSRSTFYQPGDTYPTLEKLLSEYKDCNIVLSKHTMYCFDNEAYRYVCAVQHGVTFSDKMRDDFSGSWNQAVRESQRLFDHVSKLEPHKIVLTTSVNKVRAEIMNLAKPLGDISQNICTNIALSKDKLKESEHYKANEKNLEKKLYFQQQTLIREDISYPRTVCTSKGCCSFLTDPISGNQIQQFNKICHDNCELTGVSVQVVNNPDLLRCWAMNGTKVCRVCGCSWEKHMHIRYVLKQDFVDVKDATIDQQLSENRSNQQKLADFQKMLKNKIDRLQKDSNTISEVCVQFAKFLRDSAIAPFNDAYAEYIDFLIEKEKDKIALGGKDDTKKELERMRNTYTTNLIDAFNKFDQNNATSVQKNLSPEDIHRMVMSLYNLPECGAMLKQLCSKPDEVKFTNTEIYFRPPKSAKQTRGTSAYGTPVAIENCDKKTFFQRLQFWK